MPTQYLTIALRALSQQKLHAVLNIFGLSVGIAGSLLMWMYAQNELAYDRFHPDPKSTYRLALNYPDMDLGAAGIAVVSGALKPRLLAHYSHWVKAVTRIAGPSSFYALYQNGERLNQISLSATDANVGDFFRFNILSGRGTSALARPDQVLLSRSSALKIFGSLDVLGKRLQLNDKIDLNVAGVFADLSARTHLNFDALYSMATLKRTSPSQFENISRNNFYLYVRLQPKASPRKLATDLGRWMTRRMQVNVAVFLQPLLDIHLRSHLIGEMRANGSYQLVFLAVMLAILVLLVACFNFINMATARASLRAREVAVRKVVGAGRGDLIGQFLFEAVLLTALAALLAIAWVEWLLPWFNAVLGKDLRIDYRFGLWQQLAIIVTVVAMFAGGYPAFFLSSYDKLKGLAQDLRHGKGSQKLRKLLVTGQIALTVLLLISSSVVVLQIRHLQSLPLGYDRAQVVLLPELPTRVMRAHFDSFVARLRANPQVLTVTSGEQMPTMEFNMSTTVTVAGPAHRQLQNLPVVGVNYHYLRTLGMRLLAGRDFSPRFNGDWFKLDRDQHHASVAIIITKSAMQAAGWQQPQQAIGQHWLWQWGADTQVDAHIVGVMEDVRFASASEGPVPFYLALGFLTQGRDTLAAKINPSDIPATLKWIRQSYRDLYGVAQVDLRFLDQEFNALYATQGKQSSLLLAFTGWTMVITCLGLIGLTAFALTRRGTELAVRKLLGASRVRLLTMLGMEYSLMVLWASLIAWPSAYWLTRHWLESFANRISISPMLFLGASLVVLALVFASVAGVSFRATGVHPAFALHRE